jgi:hypothetical protein
MPALVGELIYRALHYLRVHYWNPTRQWPAGTLHHLHYDMRLLALNGLRVDAQFETLRPLGPADWFGRNGAALDLYYYRVGLIVALWEGRVTSFEVILDPERCPDRSGHAFAPGRITLMNLTDRRHDLSRTSTEFELLELLGKPAETKPVLDQRVHTFIAGGNSIETSHDRTTGRLVRIEFAEAAGDTAPS